MFYCKRLNRISNKALQLDNQLCIYELLNQGFHFKIWWISNIDFCCNCTTIYLKQESFRDQKNPFLFFILHLWLLWPGPEPERADSSSHPAPAPTATTTRRLSFSAWFTVSKIYIYLWFFLIYSCKNLPCYGTLRLTMTRETPVHEVFFQSNFSYFEICIYSFKMIWFNIKFLANFYKSCTAYQSFTKVKLL